jgi:hypothetical protein
MHVNHAQWCASVPLPSGSCTLPPPFWYWRFVNLLHAAALALMGWYLMVPPVTSVELFGAGTRWTTADQKPPPLSSWLIEDTYGAAQECSAGRQQLINSARKETGLSSSGRATWLMAECIATDDPRLKEPSK